MLLGKSHFPFAYFHLPLTTSDGDTDPDPGNVSNPMYTDFRPLPHHIHYSTTSTPLPPTLQARTLEYQPLTQLLFYPQGCYIAAERQIWLRHTMARVIPLHPSPQGIPLHQNI